MLGVATSLVLLVLPRGPDPPERPLPPPPVLDAAESGGFLPSPADLSPVVRQRRSSWFISSEAQMAILSNRGQLARAAAIGFGAMYTRHSWGVGASVSTNMWRSPTLDFEQQDWVGVINPGVAFEYRFARGFARTAITMGPSVLLLKPQTDTAPGSVGVFFDLRPVGLRWQLDPSLRIGLDPLGFAVVMPDLSGIPLVDIQYMTTIRLEFLP